MIIHRDIAQGTDAWLALRAGIPTASRFSEIMTAGGKKGEPKASTQAGAYMRHLLAERIVGAPIEGFKSQYMERGSDLEDSAVAAFELQFDVETERIGFITTDDLKIGCSPDRFIVGTDEMLEAKAPTAQVHVSYLMAAAGASTEYKCQLQGQLWLCEKSAVNIISFHPGMPNAVFRVERDEAFITELAAHVRAFSNRLEEIAEDFKARGWIVDRKAEEKAPEPLDNSFLTDEDIAWAMGRFGTEVPTS